MRGRDTPNAPERVVAALAGVEMAGLGDAVVRLAPRPATDHELGRVHPQVYLDELRDACASGGRRLDADTMAGPGSFDTAALGAGAGLVAIEALRAGRGDLAFVAARPPGHHALADRAMGFCLLNNVAVAAAALADAGERVLIVDWDVHHGNGTQAIFWNDPRVLYVSVHEWPLYPGTGRAEETGGVGAPGTTVNIPIPAGATGDIVRGALDEVAAPVVERFSPTWVLVSAGFDAHRRDRLADLQLTAGDFADVAATVRAFAPGPGRMVMVLEGGYDLEALQLSVGASISGALGEGFRPEPASSGGPGRSAIDMARHAQQRVGP